MKKNYSFQKILAGVMMVNICLLSATTTLSQEIRSYSAIYSDNLKGGHIIIGNTVLYSSTTAMNSFIASPFGTNGITSSYGNDGSNMRYVDIDGETSFNSSSADLVLPGGTNTIKFARLYWGGRIDDDDSYYPNRRTVKIKKAGGTYQSVTAPVSNLDEYNISGDHYTYQAYYDVTTYINMNGAGTYTVANVAVTDGTIEGGGYFGGWALVVVYENTSKPYSSVRVYDGYLQVYDGGASTTQSITLTGLNVPSVPANASDAYMSVMAWEGDANLAASSGNPNGDYMKLNGVKVQNAVNPVVNFWNGTVSKNGAFVTTKNPDYKNQMGIDIDEQEVGIGYNLQDGTNDIPVEFGTEADQYFPSIFAFTIIAKEAVITLDKTGTTSLLPYLLLNPNEDITYTISGTNSGPGHAHNCIITDTLHPCLAYKPGSLNIKASPGGFGGVMTDANDADQAMVGTSAGKTFVKYFIGSGATGAAGGLIDVGESYLVEFKCTTPANATLQNSVVNIARITAVDDIGNLLVDDGFFVLGPGGIPLAVKMKSFTVTKQDNNAILQWVTESETRNDRYEIERSEDGINFNNVGMVKGAGTTCDRVTYSFTDPVMAGSRVLYYRLRIVDMDGKAVYSWTERLSIAGGAAATEMLLYPNPFAANPKVQVYCVRETEGVLRITNAAGQQVLYRNIKLNKGVNIMVVTELNNLNTGVFVVDVIADGVKLSQKMMKQ